MLKLTIDELAASQMTFEDIEAEYGEETAIKVGIARDPDAPRDWTMTGSPRARPAAEVVPRVLERWRRTRGKQKTPTKKSISIRLDTDVLAYYRATGRGWQSRINEALRRYTVESERATSEAPEEESEKGLRPRITQWIEGNFYHPVEVAWSRQLEYIGLDW